VSCELANELLDSLCHQPREPQGAVVSGSNTVADLLKRSGHVSLRRPRGVPATILDRQDVEQYVLARSKRKKDKAVVNNWHMPLVGASMLAGGLGLRHLADTALSPEDARRVDSFLNLSNRTKPLTDLERVARLQPSDEAEASLSLLSRLGGAAQQAVLGGQRSQVDDLTGSSDTLFNYLDDGSRIMKIRPWQKSTVFDWIHAIKPYLHQAKPGSIDSYAPYADNIADHYHAFSRGPYEAYIHQLEKPTVEEEAYRSIGDGSRAAGTVSWLLNGGKVDLGRDPTLRKSLLSPVSERMKDYAKTFGDSIGVAGLTPDTIRTKLNHGQQMDLLRGFTGYLNGVDPDLAKLKYSADAALSASAPDTAGLYVNTIRKLKTMGVTVPRVAGTALGLAGAGTLAYWLGKKLQDRRLKEQEKKKADQA